MLIMERRLRWWKLSLAFNQEEEITRATFTMYDRLGRGIEKERLRRFSQTMDDFVDYLTPNQLGVRHIPMHLTSRGFLFQTIDDYDDVSLACCLDFSGLQLYLLSVCNGH